MEVAAEKNSQSQMHQARLRVESVQQLEQYRYRDTGAAFATAVRRWALRNW